MQLFKFLVNKTDFDIYALHGKFTMPEMCYYKNDLEMARLFFEYGFNPDSSNAWGNSLIHVICMKNESKRNRVVTHDRKPWFDLLVEYGADINRSGQGYRNAYDFCLQHASQYPIIDWFLDANAKITKKTLPKPEECLLQILCLFWKR